MGTSSLNSGILTLATPTDWHKALAMGVSCRLRSPGLPLAVAASPAILEKLRGVYDHLIPERTDIRGFEHKLHLDEYSPFELTLFLDADMLVMRDVRPLMERWSGRVYMARGHYVSGGWSNFGLDRQRIQNILGREDMVNIGGAGHAYFENPASRGVFQRARDVACDYEEYAPEAKKLADEDVMSIVMTEMDLPPEDDDQIVGFLKGIDRSTLSFDVLEGRCTYIDQRGKRTTPIVLHFARDMCPLFYHQQMQRLAAAVEKPPRVRWRVHGLREWWNYEVAQPIKAMAKKYSKKTTARKNTTKKIGFKEVSY